MSLATLRATGANCSSFPLRFSQFSQRLVRKNRSIAKVSACLSVCLSVCLCVLFARGKGFAKLVCELRELKVAASKVGARRAFAKLKAARQRSGNSNSKVGKLRSSNAKRRTSKTTTTATTTATATATLRPCDNRSLSVALLWAATAVKFAATNATAEEQESEQNKEPKLRLCFAASTNCSGRRCKQKASTVNATLVSTAATLSMAKRKKLSLWQRAPFVGSFVRSLLVSNSFACSFARSLVSFCALTQSSLDLHSQSVSQSVPFKFVRSLTVAFVSRRHAIRRRRSIRSSVRSFTRTRAARATTQRLSETCARVHHSELKAKQSQANTAHRVEHTSSSVSLRVAGATQIQFLVSLLPSLLALLFFCGSGASNFRLAVCHSRWSGGRATANNW